MAKKVATKKAAAPKKGAAKPAAKKAAPKKAAKPAAKKAAKPAAKKAAKPAAKKAAKPAAKKAAKPAAKKAAKPAKKAAKPAKKRAPNPEFMKPLNVGAALHPIVGSKPLPRTEVVKKVWEYIKKHGLQDSKDKRTINADDALKAVFGGKKSVSMFEMTKLISGHLS